MQRYGVVWKVGEAAAAAGSLEFGDEGLRLVGRTHTEEVRYEDLTGVRIGRSNGDRLDGRPSVLLERRGAERLMLATVGQTALVREIADRISALKAEAQADPRDDEESNVYFLSTPGPGDSDGGDLF